MQSKTKGHLSTPFAQFLAGDSFSSSSFTLHDRPCRSWVGSSLWTLYVPFRYDQSTFNDSSNWHSVPKYVDAPLSVVERPSYHRHVWDSETHFCDRRSCCHLQRICCCGNTWERVRVRWFVTECWRRCFLCPEMLHILWRMKRPKEWWRKRK